MDKRKVIENQNQLLFNHYYDIESNRNNHNHWSNLYRRVENNLHRDWSSNIFIWYIIYTYNTDIANAWYYQSIG